MYRGTGSWGGGSKPPPHQLGGHSGERCKLPQRGPVLSPGKKIAFWMHYKSPKTRLVAANALSIWDTWGAIAPSAPWLRLCKCNIMVNCLSQVGR